MEKEIVNIKKLSSEVVDSDIVVKKKELEEIRDLLIVVDMVNGFVKEGKMADPYIQHIVPEVVKLVIEYFVNNEGIMFIKDCHGLDSAEFNKYPEHCVKGSEEAELIDELKVDEDLGYSFEKNSTSAMYAPGFMYALGKMINLKTIKLCGCCTDICVLNLALDLVNYFDQVNRKIEIMVATDAVETYDGPIHNREEYNGMALKLMKQAGCKLVRREK